MKKELIVVGFCSLVIFITGCSRLEKIFYPTKRSYEFRKVVSTLVKDMDERDNKDLVSYFAVDVRKKYRASEIEKELGKAEKGLGKIRGYKEVDHGYSGHRGGVGETVTTWELTVDTDQGTYLVYINWSNGDDRKGTNNSLYRDTQGIEDFTIYSKEFKSYENLEQLYKVDFPVLYPSIQR